jgi:hypothetical protein
VDIARSVRDGADVVVRISNGLGGTEDIVVRRTDKVLKLQGNDYHTYQIVQPEGYEEEEILHRADRGREELLSVVFITMAESGRRRPLHRL